MVFFLNREMNLNQGKGDLVFIDPPYTVRHNQNGFAKYNEKLFAWNDQKRLRYFVRDARSRGAFIVMINANHKSIHELYQKGFDLETVLRFSPNAAGAKNRGSFEELLDIVVTRL